MKTSTRIGQNHLSMEQKKTHDNIFQNSPELLKSMKSTISSNSKTSAATTRKTNSVQLSPTDLKLIRMPSPNHSPLQEDERQKKEINLFSFNRTSRVAPSPNHLTINFDSHNNNCNDAEEKERFSDNQQKNKSSSSSLKIIDYMRELQSKVLENDLMVMKPSPESQRSSQDVQTMESILEKSSLAPNFDFDKVSPAGSAVQSRDGSPLQKKPQSPVDSPRSNEINVENVVSPLELSYQILCRACKKEGVKRGQSHEQILKACRCEGVNYWVHSRCLEGEIRRNLPQFLENPNRSIWCLECQALFNVEVYSQICFRKLRECVPCLMILLAIFVAFVYFLVNLIEGIVNSNNPGIQVKTLYIMISVLIAGLICFFFTLNLLKVQHLRFRKFTNNRNSLTFSKIKHSAVLNFLKRTTPPIIPQTSSNRTSN